MSSALTSPASFLALASASPGTRRRAPPPLHADRWLALHWPPSTHRTPRDGPVAVRAEAAGKRGDDATSGARPPPRARRAGGGAGAAGKVVITSPVRARTRALLEIAVAFIP